MIDTLQLEEFAELPVQVGEVLYQRRLAGTADADDLDDSWSAGLHPSAFQINALSSAATTSGGWEASITSAPTADQSTSHTSRDLRLT